mmetsp:Transcript_43540/g.103484  ORF Transcript_43540/g.103484 Transcript_43540/m.103484 type:complete len:426 (+) Transcript_43540:333-1610(+)
MGSTSLYRLSRYLPSTSLEWSYVVSSYLARRLLISFCTAFSRSLPCIGRRHCLGFSSRRDLASARTAVIRAVLAAAPSSPAVGFLPATRESPAHTSPKSFCAAPDAAGGSGEIPPARDLAMIMSTKRPSTTSATVIGESFPTDAFMAAELPGERSTAAIPAWYATMKSSTALGHFPAPAVHASSAAGGTGKERSASGSVWERETARHAAAATSGASAPPAPDATASLRAATAMGKRTSLPAAAATGGGGVEASPASIDLAFSVSFWMPLANLSREDGWRGGCMLLDMLCEPSISRSARVTTWMWVWCRKWTNARVSAMTLASLAPPHPKSVITYAGPTLSSSSSQSSWADHHAPRSTCSRATAGSFRASRWALAIRRWFMTSSRMAQAVGPMRSQSAELPSKKNTWKFAPRFVIAERMLSTTWTT